MKDISEFKDIIEPAIGGLLLRWSSWAGEDELRALCIGFDVYNTEISVNLLTNREPYLDEQNIPAYSDTLISNLKRFRKLVIPFKVRVE